VYSKWLIFLTVLYTTAAATEECIHLRYIVTYYSWVWTTSGHFTSCIFAVCIKCDSDVHRFLKKMERGFSECGCYV
jgi:hypothetical protein